MSLLARAMTLPTRPMQRGITGLTLAALLGLGACASTQWQAQGERLTQPLCEAGGPTDTAAILWAPAWRPEQKEPARREALAEQGLGMVCTTRPSTTRQPDFVVQ